MNSTTAIAILVLMGGFLLVVLFHHFKYKRLFGVQAPADLISRDYGKHTGLLAEGILKSRERGDYSVQFGAQEDEGMIRRRNAVKLMVRRAIAALVIGFVAYFILFSHSNKAAGAIIALLVVQEVVKRLTKPEEIREKKPDAKEAQEASVEQGEPAGIWVDAQEDEQEENGDQDGKGGGDYRSGWDSKL